MLFKYDWDGGQATVVAVRSRNLLQNFCIASTESLLCAIHGKAMLDQLEIKMAKQVINDGLKGIY